MEKTKMSRFDLTTFTVALISLFCFALPGLTQDRFQILAERMNEKIEADEHRVMAFYYPWYGMPDNPDESPRHWSNINRKHMKIGSSPNYPVLGPYDSKDPSVIDQHMQWAKQHQIDTLIVSWWGHGDYSDEAMQPLLEAAAKHGINITVYYETVPDPKTAKSAETDIRKLLNRYADHSAWLRVNDRPVLFIYGRAVRQIGLQAWGRVQRILRKNVSPPPILMGDQLTPMSSMVFDGIHTYNTVNQLLGMTPGEVGNWARKTYPSWIHTAERNGRISTITVIPGYNDTKIREPSRRLPRYGGAIYRQQWKQALKSNPDWVLITSFNEWHEGSDIEPSVEYGDQFLNITGRFAEKFRSQPLREKEAGDGSSEAQLQKLKNKLSNTEIGILPGAESPVVPWLLTRLKIVPEAISWQELVEDPPNPDRVPILIYATDESFRETVNSTGDTLEALRRYMRNGGLLMVCPTGPAPFHQNLEGDMIGRAASVGLLIEIGGKNGIRGWESPPENEKLTFVQPDRKLPNFPETLSFPEDGDLRWRPYNPDRLKEKDQYVPLLRLQNGEGKLLGDAIAYTELNATEPTGGRLLYCWFRLLQMEQSDALLFDLFQFAEQQTR